MIVVVAAPLQSWKRPAAGVVSVAIEVEKVVVAIVMKKVVAPL